jgi:glycerol-3-phosphate dehydrogenase
MTAGPIMTHRGAGEELARAIGNRVKPSGAAQDLSYAAKPFPDNQNSPALDDAWPQATLADLRHAAEHEWPTNLVDLLFRRTGNGWTAGMAGARADEAAKAVAPVMGWDEARAAQEAAAYRDYIARMHHAKPDP